MRLSHSTRHEVERFKKWTSSTLRYQRQWVGQGERSELYRWDLGRSWASQKITFGAMPNLKMWLLVSLFQLRVWKVVGTLHREMQHVKTWYSIDCVCRIGFSICEWRHEETDHKWFKIRQHLSTQRTLVHVHRHVRWKTKAHLRLDNNKQTTHANTHLGAFFPIDKIIQQQKQSKHDLTRKPT